MFSRQCLGKRRIPDLATLRREAVAWKRRVNREQVKIDWRFDRKAARKMFGYKKTSYQAVRELVACLLPPRPLRSALGQLWGTADHMLKIWFVLKEMGLGVGRPPVRVTTASPTAALSRLFSFGADDGSFFVPFRSHRSLRHDEA